MGGIADKRRGLSEADVLALIGSNLSDVAGLAVTTAAGTAGTGLDASREDHTHQHGTHSTGDPHGQYQLEAEKGQANGYAGLAAGGRLQTSQAPTKALYSTGGGQAMVAGDIGAVPAGGALALTAAPPAFGALQTSPPAASLGRWVFGSWAVTNTATNPAAVAADIETSVGGGAYSEAQILTRPANAELRPANAPYAFFVPAGRRYRFTQLAHSGTTETVTYYSYLQV